MPLSPIKLKAQSGTHSKRRSGRPSQDTHEGRKGNVLGQFESWLTNREEGISALTVIGYLADLGKFAEWFLISTSERFAPAAVTPIDIRDYKSHLQTVKGFKPATINRRLAVLRTFFAWALEKGIVTENPIRVHNVEELPTAPRSLNERTYNKLLRTAQRTGDKRTLAILELLRHTGLRVSELCDLQLSDVIITPRKGKVIVRSGKRSRYREVPLNLDVRLALQGYLAIRPKVEDKHIFIGQRLNGLTDSAVQAIVSEVGRRAGIENVTPHVLRHTFGRGLIDKAVDPFTVKDLMGHKRMDSTARYTKPSVSDLEAAVAKLEVEE